MSSIPASFTTGVGSKKHSSIARRLSRCSAPWGWPGTLRSPSVRCLLAHSHERPTRRGDVMSNGPKIGIVLSGTAPALTLMSGVMLAFDECNVEFEVISTTGVGGLIGMLYLAPKGKTRKDAL